MTMGFSILYIALYAGVFVIVLVALIADFVVDLRRQREDAEYFRRLVDEMVEKSLQLRKESNDD